MPKYQGVEVRITGIVGSSIYEIQDPSKRINRGEPFTVPMNQVDVEPQPSQSFSLTTNTPTSTININGTILLPRL